MSRWGQDNLCITEGRFFCYTDKSHYFTNLTIQSIHIDLLVTVGTVLRGFQHCYLL